MLRTSIIGNLGSDPELRYTGNGTPVLGMNVASNDRGRDADGNPIEQTTWVRVSVFGTRATALADFLSKGQRVFCEGRMQVKPWTNQQNEPQAGVEITADAVEFMSPREEQAQPQAQPQRPSGAPASQQRRPAQPAAAGAPRGRQQPAQQAYDLDPADEPF